MVFSFFGNSHGKAIDIHEFFSSGFFCVENLSIVPFTSSTCMSSGPPEFPDFSQGNVNFHFTVTYFAILSTGKYSNEMFTFICLLIACIVLFLGKNVLPQVALRIVEASSHLSYLKNYLVYLTLVITLIRLVINLRSLD